MSASGSEPGVPATARAPLALALLPDGLALLAAGVGVALLTGTPRLLCALAALAAVARAALEGFGRARAGRGPIAGRATFAGALLASLPAVALLVALVVLARPAPLFAPNDSAPVRPIELSSAPAEARDCLGTESAKSYVDALYRRLDSTWAARSAPSVEGFVVMGFILDEAGGVRLSRAIEQSSDDYKRLGGEVLRAGAPFGPISGELLCLTHLELRATFEQSARG